MPFKKKVKPEAADVKPASAAYAGQKVSAPKYTEDNTLPHQGRVILRFANPRFAYPQKVEGSYYDYRKKRKVYWEGGIDKNGVPFDDISKRDQHGKINNLNVARITLVPDSKGEVIWDLSNPYQRGQAWFMINYPTGAVGWKCEVVNEEGAAAKENQRLLTKVQLYHKIGEMLSTDEEAAYDICRNLGVDIEGKSRTLVENIVYKQLETSPQSIQDIIDDPDYESNCLILRAKQSGVIVSHEGVMFFGQTPIGAKLGQAAQFLRDNPDTAEAIRRDVNNLQFA